jgi:hypothetical protein
MLDLQTSRGNVVGLGRLKIPQMPKLGFDYDIPILSFVVIERGDGSHVATCIHLQIDGYGGTINDAMKNMVSNVWYYLHENFTCAENKDIAWNNLYELSKSNPRSDILWDKYHALQFEFAKEGISTDTYSELHQKIQSLQEKVRELEARLSLNELSAPERLDADMCDSMIIKYERVKWAA